MTLPKSFRTLAESQNYILEHVFEYTSIVDKKTGQEIYIGDSYGDPTFGLIGQNETWALILGHDSYLWTKTKIIYLNKELSQHADLFKLPHDARQTSDFEVEILDDKWSDNAGIYRFNVLTTEVEKIRNFVTVSIPYDSSLKISW